MKKDMTTKLFVGVVLGILLVISGLIGTVLWSIKSEAYEGMKTLHLVIKIVVLLAFLGHIVCCLLPNARFSTQIVQTVLILIFQLAPLVARIHWKTSTFPIIILLFVFAVFVILYFGQRLAAKKFNADEDRAKHSSNYRE